MNLNEYSKKICDLLIRSGYQDEANEIEFFVKIILTKDKGDEERIIAKNKLIPRCHPKWLGDYYINDVSYKEWTDLISKFKIKLQKME